MNKTILAASVLALASLTACASSGAPAPVAKSDGWVVVADAPAVAGTSEHAGISRQPVMSSGGVMLGGAYVGPTAEEPAKPAEKFNALRVRVVGYGAPPSDRSLSPVQRRLLAMRASQLDAYRAMAEQVQGFKLSGSSTVGNMVAANDSFRVYVDAYLRGVRLLSTEFKPDGSSETIGEVVLDEGFFKAYRTALATTGNVEKAAHVMPVADGGKVGCTDSGCVSGGDYYVSH